MLVQTELIGAQSQVFNMQNVHHPPAGKDLPKALRSKIPKDTSASSLRAQLAEVGPTDRSSESGELKEVTRPLR